MLSLLQFLLLSATGAPNWQAEVSVDPVTDEKACTLSAGEYQPFIRFSPRGVSMNILAPTMRGTKLTFRVDKNKAFAAKDLFTGSLAESGLNEMLAGKTLLMRFYEYPGTVAKTVKVELSGLGDKVAYCRKAMRD